MVEHTDCSFVMAVDVDFLKMSSDAVVLSSDAVVLFPWSAICSMT